MKPTGRAVAAVALLLSSTGSTFARIIAPRQSGIVDSGIDPSCANYDTATQSANSCAYFEQYWGISHEDFVRWNPSLKADCSGIQIGHSYCVDVRTTYSSSSLSTPTAPVSSGWPTPTAPASSSSPTTTASMSSSVPSLQPGIVSTCNAFYLVTKGDSCRLIVDKFGNFTLDDFTKWNAGVGGLVCNNLWANAYVCIGITGPIAGAPSATQTPAPAGSTPAPAECQVNHPQPTQPGSFCQCNRWYLPANGEFCFDVINKFHISAAQFNTWNPRVGEKCDNLWKGYYVCVGA